MSLIGWMVFAAHMMGPANLVSGYWAHEPAKPSPALVVSKAKPNPFTLGVPKPNPFVEVKEIPPLLGFQLAMWVE